MLCIGIPIQASDMDTESDKYDDFWLPDDGKVQNCKIFTLLLLSSR